MKVEGPKRCHLTKKFLFMSTGQDREKSKLTVASTAENASDSDRNSKSAAAKLAAKVERFKQSRKSHSETRIVGGVAINTTVGKDVPLSVQSSSVSVKSEPELDNIKNKVRACRFCPVSQIHRAVSTECRQTKTKVIMILANHKRHRQYSEPIKAGSNYA